MTATTTIAIMVLMVFLCIAFIVVYSIQTELEIYVNKIYDKLEQEKRIAIHRKYSGKKRYCKAPRINHYTITNYKSNFN